LIVHTQVNGKSVGGLKLVEAGDDANLFAKQLQGFLFLAPVTLHIPTPCFIYMKRTAKYTLSPSQKVGRTVENIVSTSNHKNILTLSGYEYH